MAGADAGMPQRMVRRDRRQREVVSYREMPVITVLRSLPHTADRPQEH